MKRGGVKRPHGEEDEDDNDDEATVTMVDVLREQRALEQEARQRMLEGWGDESRCTYDSVGASCFSLSSCTRNRVLTCVHRVLTGVLHAAGVRVPDVREAVGEHGGRVLCVLPAVPPRARHGRAVPQARLPLRLRHGGRVLCVRV